ncbi:hypothetical protein [Corallibacter sp.]|uniref:hypothetical protein n=1 Tax=Corallibacter sp. TaxID=2038084 RepID=UPI003AB5FDEF
MYYKSLSLKGLFFSLFLIVAFSAHAQKGHTETLNLINLQLAGVFESGSDDIAFFKGEIHLKNGDVLTGDISLNNLCEHGYSAILSQNNNQRIISNKDIKNAVLYTDDNHAKTVFTVINDDDILYREVFNNHDNVVVYDSSVYPYENKLAETVFVKENNTLTNTFDFWTSGPKKDLINYINNRDGVNYKRRDFKSLDAVFAKL